MKRTAGGGRPTISNVRSMSRALKCKTSGARKLSSIQNPDQSNYAMEKAIKVVSGPQSEAQKNRGRIGLIKVAMRYPKGHRSRELLIKQISESYQ